MTERYGQPALVEAFVEGAELTAAVLGSEQPRVAALMQAIPRQRRSTPVRVQPGGQARLAQPGALRGAARAAGRGAGGAASAPPWRLRGARLPRRGAHRLPRDARRAAGLPGGEPAAGALAREGRHRDRDARGGHVLRRADRGDHRTRGRRGGARSGARARGPGTIALPRAWSTSHPISEGVDGRAIARRFCGATCARSSATASPSA